jgi:hypothetical protein
MNTIAKLVTSPVIVTKNNGQTTETVISSYGDKQKSVHNVHVLNVLN